MRELKLFILSVIVVFLLFNVTGQNATYIINPGVINTQYEYEINYTLTNDCDDFVLLSYKNNYTTNNQGLSFITIDISSLNQTSYYICEVRNNIIRKIHKQGSITTDILYANRTISNDWTNISHLLLYNHTSSTFNIFNSTWDETADIVSLTLALSNNISSVNNSKNIQIFVNNSINKTNFWNDYDDVNST